MRNFSYETNHPMRKVVFLPRFFTLWLTLCFALPNPAFALRDSIEDKTPSAIVARLQAGAEETIEIPGPNGSIRWQAPGEIKGAAELLNQARENGEPERETSSDDPFIANFIALRERMLGDSIRGKEEFFYWFSLLLDPGSEINTHTARHDKRFRQAIEIILLDSWDRYFLLMHYPLYALIGALPERDLEFWWYVLVRLLVLENQLNRAVSSEPIQRHLEIVELSYRMVLWKVHELFTKRNLKADPKEELSGRLMGLAAGQADLKPVISRLMTHWDEWTPQDEVAMVGDLYDRLGLDLDEEELDKDSGKIAEEVEKQQNLAQQLLWLKGALEPNSGPEKKAWDHPVDHLVEGLPPSSLVVLQSRIDFSGGIFSQNILEGRIPNAWLFYLGMFDRLGAAGVTRWLVLDAAPYIGPIQRWDVKEGSRRSEGDFGKLIREYMDGRATIPLRTFLTLPEKQEPPDVTAAIQFWEELWKLKQTYKADLRIEELDEDWSAVPGGLFVLGMTVRREELDQIHKQRGGAPVLRIVQMDPLPDYRAGRFRLIEGLRHAAAQTGQQNGWGDFQSAAVGIRENNRLKELMGNGEFWALTSRWLETDPVTKARKPSPLLLHEWVSLNDGYDEMVFTSRSEGEMEENAPAPEGETAGVPTSPQDVLVSAGLEERRSVLVPAEGLIMDGYTLTDGSLVPQRLMESELLVPGQLRLLVPTVRMETALRLYVQQGLLDEELIAVLRAQGAEVKEFMLSDTPAPRQTAIFVAAVQPDSELEIRMHSNGSTLINLYGSNPANRPQTPTALATLIRAARQFDGLLRLEGMTVDEVLGLASLDLAA